MALKFKLLITTDVSSEMWEYTNTLCRNISANSDIQIRVVGVNGSPSEEQINFAQQTDYEIIFSNKWLKWENNFSAFDQKAQEATKFINEQAKEFQADIIHLNHPVTPSLLKEKPSLIVNHSDILGQIKARQKNFNNSISNNDFEKYKNFFEQSLNNSTAMVTTSVFVAQKLFDTYKINKKTKIIHNGVCSNPNLIVNKTNSIITNLESSNKNYLNLLTQIRSKIPPQIKIYTLGQKPPHYKPMANLEFVHGVSNPNKNSLLGNAILYLSLNPWDVFNILPASAAISKCAIIGQNSFLFKELWGDCACSFEKNNINSLLKNLNNLMENELFLNKIAQNCQTKALFAFSAKRMGQEYINLYNKLR